MKETNDSGKLNGQKENKCHVGKQVTAVDN